MENRLSAANEAGSELLKLLFAAIEWANKGTLSEGTLTQAFEDC